ncbi:ETS-related transcription factor Elf-5, partial [Xylocopa sonorina]|uniref:ETS-related transcription factor Elf-5 n=1 Tax=Xylocopa sonorina TaxID=1818115 RepID=UPI00403ADF43
FPNTLEEDNPRLLDLDVHAQETSTLKTHSCEPVQKRFNFGVEENETDGTGWAEKPIDSWSQDETINWLMCAASQIGLPYSKIQHSLTVPGSKLIHFTRSDFRAHDPEYGEKLYDLLPIQHTSDILSPFGTFPLYIEDDCQQTNSSSTSDAESENSIEFSRTKQPRGRPRFLPPKKKSTSQGKLWEFIRDLLHNPETCPSLICWEDYSERKFRFVKSDDVAKRWGSRKGNTKMTYEKLSRAMRYYYKSKIFLPVLGRRLVYQFGPNAKGLQTDNPNFRF